LKYRVSLFAFSYHSQEDIAADRKAAADIMSSGKYAQSPEWADIDPIPLDDGNGDGIIPLATIAYPPPYTEATSYLRAVMAVNEMSDRALKLTEDIIKINPAHYTVWLYRAKIIKELDKKLADEIDWLNMVSEENLKNYQIWHHRQIIVSRLRDSLTEESDFLAEERDFLMDIFARDSKNYHVWIYRHWLVRHFNLWEDERETLDVETLIDRDVHNNSAWNHRYVLRFSSRDGPEAGPENSGPGLKRGQLAVVDEYIVDAELEYAEDKIRLAPENRSPWHYARGVLRAAKLPLSKWKGFASKFIIEEIGDADNIIKVHVKSSLALEWLADVYAEEAQAKGAEAERDKTVNDAVRMLTLLKEEYDPIRKNYWDYKMRLVTRLSSLSTAA
jgi:protein farnesyltransferase/geranylgeranyltransferase type-1 subunit alpha